MTNGNTGRTKFKASEIIAVIPGTGGIISTIARRLGCTWHTAKKYIDQYPTVKEAYEDERHKVDDKAISNIFQAIDNGDLGTSKWWASMKMGDEFAPRNRHSLEGGDGEPTVIKLSWGHDEEPQYSEDDPEAD